MIMAFPLAYIGLPSKISVLTHSTCFGGKRAMLIGRTIVKSHGAFFRETA